jgi:hypothetical protein
MGKPAKALLHSSLLVLVLIIVGVVYLDRIVGTAVEEGGSRALGVRTEVGSVRLGLLRGEVALEGLAIDNPEGFESARFLQLGSIQVEVPPRALLEDTVVIPRVALEDVHLTLEGSRQGTNYGRLLRNVGGSGKGGPSGEGTPEAESDGKRFVVKELVVRNVRATVALGGFGSELASTSITLPELRLHDLGSGSNGGIELAELIGRVTREVVQGVVSQRPELAAQLGSELRGRLESGARSAREGLDRLREQGLRGIRPPSE